MLAGNKWLILQACFSYDFKKNDNIILVTSKMNEINKTNLSEQTEIRLNEIIRIENDFYQEINQRKS